MEGTKQGSGDTGLSEMVTAEQGDTAIWTEREWVQGLRGEESRQRKVYLENPAAAGCPAQAQQGAQWGWTRGKGESG